MTSDRAMTITANSCIDVVVEMIGDWFVEGGNLLYATGVCKDVIKGTSRAVPRERHPQKTALTQMGMLSSSEQYIKLIHLYEAHCNFSMGLESEMSFCSSKEQDTTLNKPHHPLPMNNVYDS